MASSSWSFGLEKWPNGEYPQHSCFSRLHIQPVQKNWTGTGVVF
jgi:hypothetical protein